MVIFAETDRLILRELLPEDAAGMFALDSDPAVHRYLGNKPVQNIEKSREVIEFVRSQYVENGIGRWAVIEKKSGNFVGWSGLKFIRDTFNGHRDFHDLGYRFIQQYWGLGYATEAGLASVEYGFNTLKLPAIYAMTHVGNQGSVNVLKKIGFQWITTFEDPEDGKPLNWFELLSP